MHTPAGYWRGEVGREHAREATGWLTAQLGMAAKAGREEIRRRLTRESIRDLWAIGYVTNRIPLAAR